jgi:hypothetical protein
MRADRYCGLVPWTQRGLYSIDIALGELINIKDINYDRSVFYIIIIIRRI